MKKQHQEQFNSKKNEVFDITKKIAARSDKCHGINFAAYRPNN